MHAFLDNHRAAIAHFHGILRRFNHQPFNGPLAIGEIAGKFGVLDPAIANKRLRAARQIEHRLFGAALQIKVGEFNGGRMIPGTLFPVGPARIDNTALTATGIKLVDFTVQRINQFQCPPAEVAKLHTADAQKLATDNTVGKEADIIKRRAAVFTAVRTHAFHHKAGDLHIACAHAKEMSFARFRSPVKFQRGGGEITEVDRRAGNFKAVNLSVAAQHFR